jgi:hypothetical protein
LQFEKGWIVIMTPSESPHSTDAARLQQEAEDEAVLHACAKELVNPASGIANDYLNHFNEILLLIEHLPIMLPEMVDEILQWAPKTYREYFEQSPLPGSAETLKIYDRLPETFRTFFETKIAELNKFALASVDVISKHRGPNGEINPEDVEEFCARTSEAMRAALVDAADIVNHGQARAIETPQNMADRILNQ